MLFLVSYLPFETQIQCYLPRKASPSPDRDDCLSLELSSSSHSAPRLVVLLSIYLFVSPPDYRLLVGKNYVLLISSFLSSSAKPVLG